MAVTDLFKRLFFSRGPAMAAPPTEPSAAPNVPPGQPTRGVTAKGPTPKLAPLPPAPSAKRTSALGRGSVLAGIVAQKPIVRVTELGIAHADRTRALLEDVAARAGEERVQYAAVDPFEARETDRLPMRKVYGHLAVEGITVRLIPGAVRDALPMSANTLTRTDLLIVGPAALTGGLLDVWRFVPRMVTPTTTIVVCDEPGVVGERSLRVVTMAELARWADRSTGSSAAAA